MIFCKWWCHRTWTKWIICLSVCINAKDVEHAPGNDKCLRQRNCESSTIGVCFKSFEWALHLDKIANNQHANPALTAFLLGIYIIAFLLVQILVNFNYSHHNLTGWKSTSQIRQFKLTICVISAIIWTNNWCSNVNVSKLNLASWSRTISIIAFVNYFSGKGNT